MILSGIDIGTNSLRLLIAETGPGSFQKIHTDRRTTRLGKDLDRTGLLSPAARTRSLRALIEFKKSMDVHSVQNVLAVGTSALRKASNSALFIAEVLDRTGISIKVLPGEEEARLTLRGVLAALKGSLADGLENAVVIDIGGGSTEITSIGRDEPKKGISMPLGAVYLTERFLRHDPPRRDELEAVRNEARKHLRGTVFRPGTALIGTAGTVTTLASMDQKLAEYDPDKINRSVLTKYAVNEIVEKLSVSTLDERRRLQGLEPGREDIILAGAIIALEIMHFHGVDKMLVSDWGLREGLILDLYDKIVMSGTGTPAV